MFKDDLIGNEDSTTEFRITNGTLRKQIICFIWLLSVELKRSLLGDTW